MFRFSVYNPVPNAIFRQIPYAIGQFTVNEYCHELVYRSISEERKRQLAESAPQRFTLALGSGIIAGFAAAILSQVRTTDDSLSHCVLIALV